MTVGGSTKSKLLFNFNKHIKKSVRDRRGELRILAACIAALSGSSAWAAAEPFSFSAGPVNVYPQVKVEEKYNDNIYLQKDDKKESFVTIVSTGVMLEALKGDDSYYLGYKMSSGSYASAHTDDYIDHFVNGKAFWTLNHRNTLELLGRFEAGHEDRGTGIKQGPDVAPLEDLIEYDRSAAALTYTFGSKTSDGRLTLKLAGAQTEYTNQRDETRLRDRRTLETGAGFFWRVGNKTGLVLDVSRTHTDYMNDPSPADGAGGSKDSDYYKFLAGVSWAATDITKATFKVGRAEKRFEDESREDFSGASWETIVDWALKPYSKLRFTVERSAEESYGRGDFIDEKRVGASWTHNWNDRITSKVAYNWTRDVYENDPESRKDDTSEATLALDYAFRAWLNVGASWNFKDRDSTLDSYSHTRNLATIYVNAGF